ncbi:MAG TPA: ATP-binding protein [Actinomycetota bacterium]|nr:ATP-binding protein [Actinomycetota bacterium]
MLAFAYVLLVLIIALGIPLTINLQRRAAAELTTQALIQAQGISAAIDPGELDDPDKIDPIVVEAAQQVGGRVIVVDEEGILVADSEGPEELDTLFATPGRPEIESALSGTPNSRIRDSADLGHDIIATAVPVQEEGRVVGAVRITKNVQQVNDNVRNVTLGLIAIGLAGLAAGLLLAFGLAGSLSRPLSRLATTAKELGEGDLSARAGDVRGPREIEELGRSFDEMARRVERSVQAQREFVANASHQLRTPLTAMKLQIEGAIADVDDDEVRERLVAADREVDRLSGIVDRLLVMAREIEEGASARVDIGDAARRAVDRWAERAANRNSSLIVRGDGGTAHADPTDLDQIFDNLIDNATSYAPGEVVVETSTSNGRIVLAVRDRGNGIPPKEVTRVTERFYRGRGAPAGGSGLGLAIARQLAEKWGGTLTVDSTAGEGTRVDVAFQPSSPS